MKIIEFDPKKVSKDDLVVIYGAATGGKIVDYLLKQHGIEVYKICDRSVKGYIGNTLIEEPEILSSISSNDKVKIVITATRSFQSAKKYITEKGFHEVYIVNDFIAGNKNISAELVCAEANEIYDFYKKYPVYSLEIKDAVILPSLELFLTTKCTLICKKCSHLIPFYDIREDYNIKKLQKWIMRLLDSTDEIREVILLGGEPFLYNNLVEIITFLYSNKVSNVISIITNGTVIPCESVLKVMKDTNVRIRISDYGIHSIKLEELKQKLKLWEICYHVSDEMWIDMGESIKHDYTEEHVKDMFVNCPFANDFLLLNGRLFRCAHVGHLHNLKLINEKTDDFVDFSAEHFVPEEAKAALLKYLGNDHLYGCYYCNGINNNLGQIHPGEQITREEIMDMKREILKGMM